MGYPLLLGVYARATSERACLQTRLIACVNIYSVKHVLVLLW